MIAGPGSTPSEVNGISSGAACGLGLLSAPLLFGGIVLHELGHALVARRRGVRVDEIDLRLLGGVAKLPREPQRAVDELALASAGPAVTALLLAVFIALGAILPPDPAWLDATIRYQVLVCAAILALNLLPAFPLDGGRILRAYLWWKTGRHARATDVAGRICAFLATAMLALGALSVLVGNLSGLWTAAIGAFLLAAGRAEREHQPVKDVLGDLRAGDQIRDAPVCIPADLSVSEAIARFFARHLYTAFPVIDEQGRAVGLVTTAQVQSLPAGARPERSIGSLATSDPELLVALDTPAVDVLQGARVRPDRPCRRARRRPTPRRRVVGDGRRAEDACPRAGHGLSSHLRPTPYPAPDLPPMRSSRRLESIVALTAVPPSEPQD